MAEFGGFVLIEAVVNTQGDFVAPKEFRKVEIGGELRRLGCHPGE